MAPAEHGNKVRVHYTGRLEDNTKFDSSYDHGEPLEFTIGRRQFVVGFEQGVVGMEPGESKTIKVPADQAYGPYIPEKVIEADPCKMPPGLELKPGTRVQGTTPGGQAIEFRVVGLTESMVTLDGNHPLAGKDLIFEIKLLEIV